jgi:hypothetical protein
MAFKIDDYVEVPERIKQFYEIYPGGSLVTSGYDVHTDIGGNAYVTVTAHAYRTIDDPHPGVGLAWEITPGKTPYTRDSELMNAETSAWGRAIIALGPPFVTKKIASQEEVLNRRNGGSDEEPAKDFASKVRGTGMKGNEIRAWLQTDGGFSLEDLGPAGQLKDFLNGLEDGKQKQLLAWANG